MVILTEKRPDYKADIKSAKDVPSIFSAIEESFSCIEMELIDLTSIFMNKNWNLKEGQADSLRAYSTARKNIEKYLTKINMMNSTLARWLVDVQQPIPIDRNAPHQIDLVTKGIEKQLKFYYKTVKGSLFPKFDIEIQMHKEAISRINTNIDRINEVNQSFGQRVYPMLKLFQSYKYT